MAGMRTGHRHIGLYKRLRRQGWRATRRVSAELGKSRRWVRNHASGLNGVKLGGRWIFPPSATHPHYIVVDTADDLPHGHNEGAIAVTRHGDYWFKFTSKGWVSCQPPDDDMRHMRKAIACGGVK